MKHENEKCNFFFLQNSFVTFLCVCSVAFCVLLFTTLWTAAHQAPLSIEFSRQEYWNGLSFPFRGSLPDPWIKPASLVSPALAGEVFTQEVTCLLSFKYNSFYDIYVFLLLSHGL